MQPSQWGWHARGASSKYLGYEFAQGIESDPITDAQVRAFVAFWLEVVEPVWPGIPRYFPTHAEVDKSGITGQFDGKTDPYTYGSPNANILRQRIADEFARRGR